MHKDCSTKVGEKGNNVPLFHSILYLTPGPYHTNRIFFNNWRLSCFDQAFNCKHWFYLFNVQKTLIALFARYGNSRNCLVCKIWELAHDKNVKTCIRLKAVIMSQTKNSIHFL